jgi:ATP-dependent Clp protease ATP-binding subunit ClpC
MYEGYTDRACRVFLEMRDEAFHLDHEHTGTEHLLLAIVRVNDDLTAPVLRRFGVIEADLRREVQKIITPDLDLDTDGGWTHFIAPTIAGNEGEVVQTAPTGNEASPRHFTPRLLTCLMRLALFEAKELGDEHIGPEHLLLAVLREGHGISVEALTNLGVDVTQLTLAIYSRIAEAPESSDPTVPQPTDERQATLDTRRMLAEARLNMDDRVVFAHSEAARVYCVLDGLDRLLDKGSESVIEEITKVIGESFSFRAGQASKFTPAQERQIVSSIVSGLRRQARLQLGD